MKNSNNNFIDLVVAGPDFSGTSTQISTDTNSDDYKRGSIVSKLIDKGYSVRDIRGTEFNALFHSNSFSDLNKTYISLEEYLQDPENVVVHEDEQEDVKIKEYKINTLKSRMFDMVQGLNGNKIKISFNG